MKYATYKTNNILDGFFSSPPSGNYVAMEDSLWQTLVTEQFGNQVQFINFTPEQLITSANIKYIENNIMKIVDTNKIFGQQIGALLMQMQTLQMQIDKLKGTANG